DPGAAIVVEALLEVQGRVAQRNAQGFELFGGRLDVRDRDAHVVEAGDLLARRLAGAAGDQLEVEVVVEAEVDDPGLVVLVGELEERLEAELLVEGHRRLEIAALEVDVPEREERAHFYLPWLSGRTASPTPCYR